MKAIFPNEDWVTLFETKLNEDKRYGEIARNWEGDILFHIQPDGSLSEPKYIYLDLWHGKCRSSKVLEYLDGFTKPAFILEAQYSNFVKVVQGQLDPMQAMLTRKLKVQGSMAYLMRNVPVVLDFVRCAREITAGVL